jgi:hypothetical protein
MPPIGSAGCGRRRSPRCRSRAGPARPWPAAIEVGQPVGVGLIGPGEPKALDLVLKRAVLDQAGWLDAAADRVRREARRGGGGVGIRAHQLSGARPLQLAALEDQAVDALPTRPPAARSRRSSGSRSRPLAPARSARTSRALRAARPPTGSSPNPTDLLQAPAPPWPQARRRLLLRTFGQDSCASSASAASSCGSCPAA